MRSGLVARDDFGGGQGFVRRFGRREGVAQLGLEPIESRTAVSKPVPAEFGVDGFYFRHERHFVYWRRLSDGAIGIVTVLHERMHLMERFRQDFE
jgi:plasmid stabilization system protein ParE